MRKWGGGLASHQLRHWSWGARHVSVAMVDIPALADLPAFTSDPSWQLVQQMNHPADPMPQKLWKIINLFQTIRFWMVPDTANDSRYPCSACIGENRNFKSQNTWKNYIETCLPTGGQNIRQDLTYTFRVDLLHRDLFSVFDSIS